MRRLMCASAVLLMLLGACGGSADDDDSTADSKTTATTAGPVAAVDGLDIGVEDNYFDPKIVTGEPGTLFRFDLVNEGGSLHNFSLAPTLDVDIAAGTKKTVEVVFPDAGEVEFFCKYHKVESGMTGVLRAAA